MSSKNTLFHCLTESMKENLFDRIRGYNAINIKNGYKQLGIRSPRDFIKYEDD